MTTLRDIDSFANFARARAAADSSNLTIDELFELWRSENPSGLQGQEDLEAARAALNDYRDGERGRPAGEFTSELRRQLGGAVS